MIVTLRTLFISVSALLVCNMAGLAATDVSSPAESLQTEIEASQVEVEVIKKEMTAEQKRSIQNYNELIDQLHRRCLSGTTFRSASKSGRYLPVNGTT